MILRRLQEAVEDISHYDEYDFLIINDNFDHAKEELKAILLADRNHAERQLQQHRRLVDQLLGTQ